MPLHDVTIQYSQRRNPFFLQVQTKPPVQRLNCRKVDTGMQGPVLRLLEYRLRAFFLGNSITSAARVRGSDGSRGGGRGRPTFSFAMDRVARKIELHTRLFFIAKR